MSLMSYSEILLLNLEGKIQEGFLHSMSKETAHRRLRELTKQDFGYDPDKWREWFEEREKARYFNEPD